MEKSSSSKPISDDKEEIDFDKVFNSRYLIKKKLGAGTFGRVYLVEDKLNKSEYFVIIIII